jgi:hypothetical protein
MNVITIQGRIGDNGMGQAGQSQYIVLQRGEGSRA